jgi:hypothetical protein
MSRIPSKSLLPSLPPPSTPHLFHFSSLIYRSCKTAYAGHIAVEYSIDHGVTWTQLAYYYAWKYRQDNFFPIKLPIPQNGKTKATRFRFIQKTFEADKDNWALDNVRVFHLFKTNWNRTPQYLAQRKVTPNLIQFAQCCFDTEWCETRLSENDLNQCNKIEWYQQTNYALRGIELYLCLAFGLTIFKFLYLSMMNYLMKGRYPFHDEIEEFSQFDQIMKFLPPHWRLHRTFHDYYEDIHTSARVNKLKKNIFLDKNVNETDEEMKRRKQEEERVRKYSFSFLSPSLILILIPRLPSSLTVNS